MQDNGKINNKLFIQYITNKNCKYLIILMFFQRKFIRFI